MKNSENLKFNASLARCNTWRVGGRAKCLFMPQTIQELRAFLKNLFQLQKNEKIFFLGLGSNLLIRETGFDGTVIMLQGRLNQIEINPQEKNTVRIEAGASCGTAARFCARAGLRGIEFLAGVPGTMGGALAMNAGAHGGETWQFVTHCETVDRQGSVRLRPAKDYIFSYRHVSRPAEEWFTAAHLRLTPGNAQESLAKIKHLLSHRASTQPINLPNCGSVFRNPENTCAAQLIESCRLKGFRIGGASVSHKHANFIVNDQSAKADDIESLMHYVQSAVKRERGIALSREVQFLE